MRLKFTKNIWKKNVYERKWLVRFLYFKVFRWLFFEYVNKYKQQTCIVHRLNRKRMANCHQKDYTTSPLLNLMSWKEHIVVALTIVFVVSGLTSPAFFPVNVLGNHVSSQGWKLLFCYKILKPTFQLFILIRKCGWLAGRDVFTFREVFAVMVWMRWRGESACHSILWCQQQRALTAWREPQTNRELLCSFEWT